MILNFKIRIQRGNAVNTSGSSADARPQSRRRTRDQNRRSINNGSQIRSPRRSNEIQVNRVISSSSNYTVTTQSNLRRNNLTNDSSENDDTEESIRLIRHRNLRPLSDYDTGDSTDNDIRTSEPTNNPGQRCELSDSSSDDMTIPSRLGRRCKRRLNYISSTDSSDSGMPIGFRRSIKRTRLPSSSESSDSVDSHESNAQAEGPGVEPVEETDRIRTRTMVATTSFNLDAVTHHPNNETRGSIPSERIQRIASNQNGLGADTAPQTTRMNLPTRAHSSRILSHDSNNEGGSDSGPVLRGGISRGRIIAVIQSEDESNSSDNEIIRPRVLSNGRALDFQSDNTSSSSSSSSSSDTDDSQPIRGNRPSLRRTILLSDDEASPASLNIFIKYTPDMSEPVVKIKNNDSSDSDEDSEKCPICLTQFRFQFIGKPSTCHHSFCCVCIQEWAKNNNTCPVDRQPFNGIIVFPNLEGKALYQIPVRDPARPMQNGAVAPRSTEVGDGTLSPDSSSEENERDEICCVCNRTNRIELMICCDQCNYVYHMDCVNPPLRSIPVTQWYCPPCVEHESSSEDSNSY